MLSIDDLKKDCVKIHFFGLGFIQIKLNSLRRWHFYSSKLPAFVEHPHDHRYIFTSTIHFGRLTQRVYGWWEPLDETEATHDIFSVNCNEGEAPILSVKNVAIEQHISMDLTVGSSYTLRDDLFHTVESFQDSITELSIGKRVKNLANVLQPKGLELFVRSRRI